ncbi:MAG: DUF948 domain-containing protein [Candidatus Aminicenantes bacterium]|nr:DUF948 domain-containing protein [Candidatus Aminicenantes bacterium]
MDSVTIVIIFIVALIFSVGFLLVVISLVPALNQLKSLLADLEKTSYEARKLTIKLQDVSEKVDDDLAKINSIIDTTRESVGSVSNSLKFLNKNLLKQSAGFLAFIPALKLGWKFVKKRKGGKNE